MKTFTRLLATLIIFLGLSGKTSPALAGATLAAGCTSASITASATLIMPTASGHWGVPRIWVPIMAAGISAVAMVFYNNPDILYYSRQDALVYRSADSGFSDTDFYPTGFGNGNVWISPMAMHKITKDKLYQSALALYKHKDIIEKHVSQKTNELFDLQDRIMLYDLSNTYFEGAKRTSNLTQYGRSKEKRSDAKLVVLATVYHQSDDATMAHLHLGLLAYWLVNTIRH